MPTTRLRGVAFIIGMAVAVPPFPTYAQTAAPAAEATATEFNVEQLDAMLAPIALYPDELLAQALMASTYPLQVVAAARWLETGDNKKLTGEALAKALEKENWDPSVKSLIPFPQVIAMMNDKLEWTQQLGYAVATQQAAVFDSVQRLRRQAQSAGTLKPTPQQKVEVREEKVIIQPADPAVVYVPAYNPNEVYGTWPYPSYPPVYYPPPPAYYPGYAVGAGLAFATGVAVVGGLYGWANPNWNNGNVSINPLNYNQINVNRTAIQSNTWQAPTGSQATQLPRVQNGPVGAPARQTQLPANAVGRNNVGVPATAVNRAQISSGLAGTRPGAAAPAQRPSAGQLPSATQRPAANPRAGTGQPPAAGQRPGATQPSVASQRSATTQRPDAFNGIKDGARAGQFSARGAQSRGARAGRR